MIHFLTFSDSKMRPTLNRIEREAIGTGWFDTVTAIDEKSFNKEYFKHVKATFYMRGFGYWRWKPYIVLRKLQQIQNNDILVYADAGCTINKDGYEMFQCYIKEVQENQSGMLFFEHKNERERAWTKMDLLDFLNYKENKLQLVGGGGLRKCNDTIALFEKFLDISMNHFDLMTDSPSKLENDESFIEHRHDQSVLSILGHGYHPAIRSVLEIWTASKYEEALKSFPIWATRKRQYSKWGDRIIRLKKRFPQLFRKLY